MKKIGIAIMVAVSLTACSKRGFVINFSAIAPASDNYQRTMDGQVYEKYYTTKGLSTGFSRCFELVKEEILKMGQKTVKP